jgi:hypothetical protein
VSNADEVNEESIRTMVDGLIAGDLTYEPFRREAVEKPEDADVPN